MPTEFHRAWRLRSALASEPILTGFDLRVAKRTSFWVSQIWLDFLALTKPEINLLIVVTTFAGFYLGCASAWHDFPFLRSINAVLGTLLVASGTGALNQYVERRFDAHMRRTARRPLAAGRLKPSAVLWFVLHYRLSELFILPLQSTYLPACWRW